MKFNFKLDNLYSNTNRTYKILGLVLVIIGTIGLTYPNWGEVFGEERNPLETLGVSELAAQEIAPSLLPIDGAQNPAPNDKAVAAYNRLVIEKAGVDMPLFVSDNEKILLKGGWVFAGASRPDKGSNTVIFGHRWLYKPPVKNTFYNLDKVAAGDRFSIQWQNKTYNYEVSEVKVVNPSDVWIMNHTGTPQVTLVTCTPLFSTKQRLVVVGKLI